MVYSDLSSGSLPFAGLNELIHFFIDLGNQKALSH
jgi:hypothetical protein